MSAGPGVANAQVWDGLDAVWCRSCGSGVAEAGAGCPACGVDLAAPHPGPGRVGRVVVLGGKLLSRHGIAVAETPDGVTVLSKEDAGTTVPRDQFDASRTVPVPGPAVVGAAGRLWAANAAVAAGAIKGKWSREAVDTAAAALATQTVGARRGAALDAIALGLTPAVERMRLTPSEVSWYRARACAVTGDLPAMLACLEALPRHGYGARVQLLLSRAARLLDDPALAARALAQLLPYVETSLDARGLYLALDRAAAPDTIEVAIAYPDRLTTLAPPVRADLSAVASSIRGGQRMPVLPPVAVPALRALDACVAGLAGAELDGVAELLGVVPLPVLDRLVAAGALTRTPNGASPWPPDVTAYLRCRIDPGRAATDELRQVGHHAELARRLYLQGDDVGLAQLGAGDPAVRHYRALRAFVTTGAIDEQALRPEVRDRIAAVAAVRATPNGATCTVPALLAADPSCWPLLRDLAVRGQLTTDDETRRRHPDFSAWLDLCAVQRMVFDAAWSDVAASGGQLAAASTSEIVADEAKNMVAFAQWQLGRSDEALRVLDEALAGQFTTGLVVNAALVAAERGCLPAFPYLARAMRLADDPRVRQGALGRAITLWLADKEVDSYPPQLAEMVHEALANPQPDDDFHRMLLLLSANHDWTWLADARPAAAGAAQNDAVSYYRVRGRVLSSNHRESFLDVVNVLVGLWHRTPRWGWVADERTWITELFQDLVHRDFGEASGLASAIDAAATGDLFDLKDRLVLTAQAGAHVAAQLRDDGGEISAEAEGRLLFEPVRQFRARNAELSDDDRELVSAELGRCVGMAAISVASVIENRMDAFADDWNATLERLRWDQHNQWALRTRQRELLDQVDRDVARCRAYLELMNGLALSEKGVEWRELIENGVRTWSGEATRLRRTL